MRGLELAAGPCRCDPQQDFAGPQGSASRKSGDSDPSPARELGFLVCEMGTWIRPCPPNTQAAGRPAPGQGAAAGYLRRGPDEGGRRPGSRCASSGLRPCGSGGAGPWRARRVAARRLLFCLRGRETETGVRGEARERPGRVPRPGECSAAPHGASVRRPGTANSLAAFFKTRIQRLPVAGSGTPLAQSDSREGQWEHRPKGERRAPSEGVTDRR